jgi:hypothetical protein
VEGGIAGGEREREHRINLSSKEENETMFHERFRYDALAILCYHSC